MAARKPVPPPKEAPLDETTTDDDDRDGGDGAGSNGAGDGDSRSDAHIREIVREVVADLLRDDGGDDGGDTGEPGGGRLIDEERRVQQRVEAELERVRAASDLEELKEKVTKIVEKVPVKWRVSTRIMGWASEDDR